MAIGGKARIGALEVFVDADADQFIGPAAQGSQTAADAQGETQIGIGGPQDDGKLVPHDRPASEGFVAHSQGLFRLGEADLELFHLFLQGREFTVGHGAIPDEDMGWTRPVPGDSLSLNLSRPSNQGNGNPLRKTVCTSRDYFCHNPRDSVIARV